MYYAFGLNIDSDIELPELITDQVRADFRPRLAPSSANVRFRFGSVPENIEAHDKGICFQSAPSRVLVNIPKVARFDIRDGEEIVVARADGVCDATVRLFLLGYAVGALLHQRGLLVLHAAVVARGEHCLALAGVSSVGKSTLAAGFVERGYQLLSDEICAVETGRDVPPRVLPGYPVLLLWERTLKKLALNREPLGPVRPELKKFVVPVRDRFCDTSKRLTHMFVLNSHNESDVSLKQPEGFGRFNAFLNHTFQERYLKGMGLAASRQRSVAAAVPHVPVTQLCWPQSWDDIERAVSCIEKDLKVAEPAAAPNTQELLAA